MNYNDILSSTKVMVWDQDNMPAGIQQEGNLHPTIAIGFSVKDCVKTANGWQPKGYAPAMLLGVYCYERWTLVGDVVIGVGYGVSS